MKVATLMLAFAITMVTALTFLPGETPDASAIDVIARGIDCGACARSYDFCVKNGHTEGQTGCKQTCLEHVCHRDSGCKSCGDPFNECPQESRYIRKE
ncbi:hypothetical protein J1614_006561 [Plenodomus biglobosus]|nr:hypothetical protein J1614_006561 [Plenodomus biglobosus]